MRPEQATLDGERQTTFGKIVEAEPTVDGITQVLVSSSTNGRTSYHKQDVHNEGEPACSSTLRASHTEWRYKPKVAMQRACDPCPDCYPEVASEE